MLSRGLQFLFTDTPLTVLGLVLFVGAHGSIVARLLFGGSKAFETQAHLPLTEEAGHE